MQEAKVKISTSAESSSLLGGLLLVPRVVAHLDIVNNLSSEGPASPPAPPAKEMCDSSDGEAPLPMLPEWGMPQTGAVDLDRLDMDVESDGAEGAGSFTLTQAKEGEEASSSSDFSSDSSSSSSSDSSSSSSHSECSSPEVYAVPAVRPEWAAPPPAKRRRGPPGVGPGARPAGEAASAVVSTGQ